MNRIKLDPQQLSPCPLGTDELTVPIPTLSQPTPIDSITHRPHSAWVSRPRSWVQLGALWTPRLTTLLLAGLNEWTASQPNLSIQIMYRPISEQIHLCMDGQSRGTNEMS
jgi:hypothetical protein